MALFEVKMFVDIINKQQQELEQKWRAKRG
jgi:hypothetical protein